MPEAREVGCARPTGGPVGETIEETSDQPNQATNEAVSMIQAQFSLPADH